MSTKQSTIDYILDQLSSLEHVSARKMFGEYALYCNDKVVGLVCDDTLFIKITEKWKSYVGKSYIEWNAYKWAKVSMVIEWDMIEDHEWLSELIQITADNLPEKKLKKSKTK